MLEIFFSWEHCRIILILILATGSFSFIGCALSDIFKLRYNIICLELAISFGIGLALLNFFLLLPLDKLFFLLPLSEIEKDWINPLVFCILFLGALFYFLFDKFLNSQGASARKISLSAEMISEKNTRQKISILQDLAKVDVIRSLEPAHAHDLVSMVHEVTFEKGEVLFREGDEGSNVYFISSGKIHIIKGEEIHAFSQAGDILGEIALLTRSKRTATAISDSLVQAWSLSRRDFDILRSQSPSLDKASKDIALQRLEIFGRSVDQKKRLNWITETLKALDINDLRQQKVMRKKVLDDLSRVELLRKIRYNQIPNLLQMIKSETFEEGTSIFNQGDTGERIYFIRSGRAKVFRSESEHAICKKGDVLGELSLVKESRRAATAVADSFVETWSLLKKDFDILRNQSPELNKAAKALAAHDLEIYGRDESDLIKEIKSWVNKARLFLLPEKSILSSKIIKDNLLVEPFKVGLFIFIGTFLDQSWKAFLIIFVFLSTLFIEGNVDLNQFSFPLLFFIGLSCINLFESFSNSYHLSSLGFRTDRKYMFQFFQVCSVFILSFLLYFLSILFSSYGTFLLGYFTVGSLFIPMITCFLVESFYCGGYRLVAFGGLLGYALMLFLY